MKYCAPFPPAKASQFNGKTEVEPAALMRGFGIVLPVPLALLSASKALTAVECRTTLTPHDVVMARAANAAERLDKLMASMRGTGVLKEFNRAYKRRREAAFARGERFMLYKVALARLRTAMIPILMNGGNPVLGASLFAQVFDT